MRAATKVVTLASMLLGGWAWAGTEDTNQPPPVMRLELDLADGSHIIGIPKIESVPVQTSYAKVDIPLKQIASLKLADDHETASLDFVNGDKLKGVVALKPLELTTVFGPVKIGIEHLREIVVSSGEGLSAILARDLVLYYSFDRDEGGKVTDKSGKGHDARTVGARWTAEGKAGGGYEVGRNLGYIETPNHETWSFPRRDFGMGLWLRLNSVPNGEHMIIGHDEGGGERNKWSFEFLSGNIDFHVNTFRSESYRIASRPWRPELGRWYHLAVTRKEDTFTIYIDGAVFSTEDNRLPLPVANAPLTIGQGEGLYVDGVLDEIMIFDRALSAAEIRKIHNGQRGR